MKKQLNLYVDEEVLEHLETISAEWRLKKSDAMAQMIERQYRRTTRQMANRLEDEQDELAAVE